MDVAKKFFLSVYFYLCENFIVTNRSIFRLSPFVSSGHFSITLSVMSLLNLDLTVLFIAVLVLICNVFRHYDDYSGGWRLLTFFIQMQWIFRSGAYLSKYSTSLYGVSVFCNDKTSGWYLACNALMFGNKIYVVPSVSQYFRVARWVRLTTILLTAHEPSAETSIF